MYCMLRPHSGIQSLEFINQNKSKVPVLSCTRNSVLACEIVMFLRNAHICMSSEGLQIVFGGQLNKYKLSKMTKLAYI